MARGLVSLLSLFLLSATAPTGLYAFTCPHPSIATFQRPNADYCFRQLHTPALGATAHRRTRQTTDLLAVTSGEASPPLTSEEDRLREEGVGGTGRARLAESIGEEFRVRVNEVRQTYDARLEQERASHRLEMAQQRVKLLQVRGGCGYAPGKRRSFLGSRWLRRPDLSPPRIAFAYNCHCGNDVARFACVSWCVPSRPACAALYDTWFREGWHDRCHDFDCGQSYS